MATEKSGVMIARDGDGEKDNVGVIAKGKLSSLLAGGKGVVLDGALATHLETLGADISSSLWSASLLSTAPALIHQTHASYFSAGAQIATTASYQASIPGLTSHLHTPPSEASALVAKSVHLAQDARSSVSTPATGPLLIAGSVGPYGAYLANGSEYTGAYTLSPDEFKAFHRGRITALLDAGADVLACETLPSYAETMALAQMLDAEFPTTESFFAFTLSSPTALPDGTPLSACIPALEPYANIVAVGINCVSPELALEGLKEIAKYTRKPLVVYPNSGEQWDAGARQWGGRKSEGGELVRWVEDVWAAGGRVVGGCCRTGPDEIGVIAGRVEAKNEGL